MLQPDIRAAGAGGGAVERRGPGRGAARPLPRAAHLLPPAARQVRPPHRRRSN